MLDPNVLVKFHRAGYHLDELEVKLRDWVHEGHHTHWLEDDPEEPDYLLIKATAEEVPANPFSAILGDAIQNFRSSLDHVALALNRAFTDPLPEEIEYASQFPIVGDRDRKGQPGQGAAMFQGQEQRISGMDPNAQAFIRSLQPYKRGLNYKLDPLWRLSELSNIDKHRLPHLVTSYVHAITFDPFHSGSKFPILTYKNARQKAFSLTGYRATTNTVIGRIQIERISPERNMNVELEISPSIAFADGWFAHDDAIDVLREIQTHIGGMVLPDLLGFL